MFVLAHAPKSNIYNKKILVTERDEVRPVPTRMKQAFPTNIKLGWKKQTLKLIRNIY